VNYINGNITITNEVGGAADLLAPIFTLTAQTEEALVAA